jgi:mannose-1-phosphate guanylyltransferase
VKALLLAAGEGTRLRPLTADCPKPMLPVGGRPILEHLVTLLRDHGVNELAINLHYKPRAIVDHFGDGRAFGVSITYLPEERLLGSAGTAKALEWFLTEPFFVLYGDVLTDIALTALANRHLQRRALATLAVYEVDDPSRCGIVELDADGWVQRFVEKPPPGAITGNLANAGIYVLEPEILRYIAPGQPADFGADVFPRLLGLGLPVQGERADGYVLDIGSPTRYAQAQVDFQLGRFRAGSGQSPTAAMVQEAFSC